MKTFKDFLEWYNNLDVLPFVEAIEKMKEFYKLKRLDIFKDGVSLPGLVLKYLIKVLIVSFIYLMKKIIYMMKNKGRETIYFIY